MVRDWDDLYNQGATGTCASEALYATAGTVGDAADLPAVGIV